MENVRDKVVVCRLSNRAYVPLWELQREIQSRLVREKRTEHGSSIPHVLILVEHPPVYTLGKSGNRANLLVTEDELAERKATFVHTDRGGDITYHGPGQLVGYPILDLDRFYTDVHRYMRDLEEVIIRTCGSYEISAGRVEGRTGVWIMDDENGPDRKIAAMGIRCSRWVTMHGFGFNLNTELERYDAIIPCGISDGRVTSMAAELGKTIDEIAVQNTLVAHFKDVFDVEIEVLSGAAADGFIEAYLSGEPVL